MDANDYQKIRQLLDDYLRMYASRDDLLTTYFSEDFAGFTGGGDFLVKDREEWIAITRQDFAQVKDPIRIELKDFAIQSLADNIAVTTSFFNIHLPFKDEILSRETARLVLIFRKESTGWKISHSSISIPYNLVRKGEVYPLKELLERNRALEELISERTIQLSEANNNLQQNNAELSGLAKKICDSEAHFRLLTEDVLDVVWKVDRDLRFTYISPADERLRGYRADEVIGRHLSEVLTEEGLATVAKIMRQRREAEQNGTLIGSITFEAQHRCKDGRVLWGEVLSKPERDAHGTIIGYHGITREITERKQAELERKKLEAQNRQLQKTESLGRMAGAIAHYFNNQLGVVIGNLDLAMTEVVRGTIPHDRMTAALRASNRAAGMSSLMLTYLGQSFEKHEPLELSETCLRSLPILNAIMPADSVLETEFPSPGPVIMANANQILQVLSNLITNAWEAMGGGPGTIHLCIKTVCAAAIPAAHRFPLDWHPKNNAPHACLEVTDEGCGIEDEDIDKLFDPFFSNKFSGRGMGLAVVLGIVRAHSGVVTVESEASRGSTFRVFFPVSEEPVPRKPNKSDDLGDTLISGLPPREMEGRVTVLVVEDDEMLRDIDAAMLKQLGFLVIEAKDGVEAVEVFRERQDEVRCVICDLTMPRLNGWETLSALRRLVPGIPVILSSGYDEAHVMTGDHPELPQVFLGKPYNLKELSEAISHALVIQ